MIVLQPIGGLCNRMRAINSAYMLAKERGDKLCVLWFHNEELNCPFEKLFLSTDKIKVINISSKWSPVKLWYQFIYDFVSNDEIRVHRGDGLLDETYRSSLPKNIYIATEEHFYPCHSYELFRPVPVILAKIDKIRQQFGPHAIGVHIRRTDNKLAMEKSSTDAFISAMKSELKNHPDTMFYVATDDLMEEEKLRKQFPGKILSNQKRDLSRNTITGIQDALLDLYCLANTTKIIGSYFSSFTDIAADINGITKTIAGQQ